MEEEKKEVSETLEEQTTIQESETTEENVEKEEVKAEETSVEIEETKTEDATVAEETKIEDATVVEETAKKESNKETTKTETLKKEKKSGKKVGVIIGIIAAVLAVIVLVILIVVLVVVLVLNRKTKVDVNDFIIFEENGYDGFGTISCEFDYDAFAEKYPKIKYREKEVRALAKEELSEYTASLNVSDEELDRFIDEMITEAQYEEAPGAVLLGMFLEDGNLSQTEDLSNFDSVNYSFLFTAEEMEKAFKIKLVNYGDIEHIMSDLKAVKRFDAFEGVEVSYSGIAPNGDLSVNETYFDNYSVTFDKYSGLSNGDVVTASLLGIGDERNYVERTGSLPLEMTKTYVVEGLPSYVNTFAEITDDCFASMDNQARARLESHYTTYDHEIANMECIGTYFLKDKDATSSYRNNMIYLVYKIRFKMTIQDSKKNEQIRYADVYNYVMFENLVAETDGSVITDLNDSDMETWNGYRAETDVVTSSFFGMKNYYSESFSGFETLDELYSDIITTNIDEYNHEDNVTDIEFDETSEEETEEVA